MREIVLEEDAVELGEKRGWLVRKITYPGRRGAPDRHFYKGGKLLIVEFKKPGERPSLHQEREHERLRAHGWKVHVIDNWEAFNALIT